MCGRAALVATFEDLRDALGLDDVPERAPQYNIPPSQPLAVVRTRGKLEWLRWGLVPFWADDRSIGNRLALARSETVLTTPAFREAIRRRRCLVIVSGFFEWQTSGSKQRQPFFICRSDHKPFAIAGIWERWSTRDGEVIDSCAILTQPASGPLEVIHDRMPMVLERDTWDRWLDPAQEDVAALLEPRFPALVSFPVGTYVNDPRHNDPGCMEIAEPPRQRSLFGG